jgi:hypothetical protein
MPGKTKSADTSPAWVGRVQGGLAALHCTRPSVLRQAARRGVASGARLSAKRRKTSACRVCIVVLHFSGHECRREAI